jgi:hypothetical protein
MTDETHGSARCKTCGQFYGDHGICVTPGCPGDATPAANDDEDSCAYCGTIFEAEDLFYLEPRGEAKAMLAVIRVARCARCHAIHSQGTCGTCNTEAYHPTIDNTPWGQQGCRRCTMPDPFTNLLGFVSSVVVNAQRGSDALTQTQEHNTALTARTRELERALQVAERDLREERATFLMTVRLHGARIADLETELAKTLDTQQRLHQRNEDVHRINTAVHEQMAHFLRAFHERVAAIDPLTPDEALGRLLALPRLSEYPVNMAEEYATNVATTQRFHGDVHIGLQSFNTITDAVRHAFTDGIAAGIRWEGERRAR